MSKTEVNILKTKRHEKKTKNQCADFVFLEQCLSFFHRHEDWSVQSGGRTMI